MGLLPRHAELGWDEVACRLVTSLLESGATCVVGLLRVKASPDLGQGRRRRHPRTSFPPLRRCRGASTSCRPISLGSPGENLATASAEAGDGGVFVAPSLEALPLGTRHFVRRLGSLLRWFVSMAVGLVEVEAAASRVRSLDAGVAAPGDGVAVAL